MSPAERRSRSSRPAPPSRAGAMLPTPTCCARTAPGPACSPAPPARAALDRVRALTEAPAASGHGHEVVVLDPPAAADRILDALGWRGATGSGDGRSAARRGPRSPRCARCSPSPSGAASSTGRTCPLDTDTRIAVALASELARRRDDVLVAPPPSPTAPAASTPGFAGTLSIGQAALEHVVVELVRSADHFAGVVLVNGHGGNTPSRGAGRRHAAVARAGAVLAWSPSGARAATPTPGASRRRCCSPSPRTRVRMRPGRAGLHRAAGHASSRRCEAERGRRGRAERRARRPDRRLRGRGGSTLLDELAADARRRRRGLAGLSHAARPRPHGPPPRRRPAARRRLAADHLPAGPGRARAWSTPSPPAPTSVPPRGRSSTGCSTPAPPIPDRPAGATTRPT